MKTNQIFSIKRFINLIKSDLLINYKKYGLMILAISLVYYVILYLNMPKYSYNPQSVYNTYEYYPLFISLGLFTLAAWIGSAFPAFNNKNTARSYLTTPASTFEKYTAQFLGRIIVSTIIFLIIFWIDARLARFTILNTVKDNIPNIKPFTYSAFIDRLKADTFTLWILPFGGLSLVLFLFSVRIYFGKHGLIKAILSLAAVIFIIYILFAVSTQFFYSGYKFFGVKTPDYQVTEKLNNGEIFTIIIFGVSWIFFTILGFFKLKEKEL